MPTLDALRKFVREKSRPGIPSPAAPLPEEQPMAAKKAAPVSASDAVRNFVRNSSARGSLPVTEKRIEAPSDFEAVESRELRPGETGIGPFTPRPKVVERSSDGSLRVTNPDGGQFLIDSSGRPVLTERLVTPEQKRTIRGGSYADTGLEVDHRISKALGGTDQDTNLQALRSEGKISEDAYGFMTGLRAGNDYQPKTRQEGKVLVEQEAIRKYRAGEITFDEARSAVINWRNPELVSDLLGRKIEMPEGDGNLDDVIETSGLDRAWNAAKEFMGGAMRRLRGAALPAVEYLNGLDAKRESSVLGQAEKRGAAVRSFVSRAAMRAAGVDPDDPNATRINPDVEFRPSLRAAGQAGVETAKMLGTTVAEVPKLLVGSPIRFAVESLKEIPGVEKLVGINQEKVRKLTEFLDPTKDNKIQRGIRDYLFGPEDFAALSESESLYGQVHRGITSKLEANGVDSRIASVAGFVPSVALGMIFENPAFGGEKKAVKEAIEVGMREMAEKELGRTLTKEEGQTLVEEALKISRLASKKEKQAAAYQSIAALKAGTPFASKEEGEALAREIAAREADAYVKAAEPPTSAAQADEALPPPVAAAEEAKIPEGFEPAPPRDEAAMPSFAEVSKGRRAVFGNKTPDASEIRALDGADRLRPAGQGDDGLPPSPENVEAYRSARKAIENNWWLNARESVEDSWIRVKKLEAAAAKLEPNMVDRASPYMAETLYHGRVGTRTEAIASAARDIDKEMVDAAKNLGLKSDDVNGQVNRYLHSLHAPERNAKLGDGAAGITTAQAEKNLAEIKSLPHFEEIKRISDRIADINRQTLDTLYAAQVIDKKTLDTLRQTYQNHVPLNRVFDDEENVIDALVSKGYDVRSTGIRRAKGSDREVADILGNVVANAQSAIARAEKNIVDLETLRFAEQNQHLGIFEIEKPRAIGRSFSKDGKPGEMLFDQSLKTDPMVLTMRKDGKPVHLRIKDERLAMALKGVGQQHLPNNILFRAIEAFTRTYAGVHTRFNPEFAFSNKIRDLQDLATYASSQGVGAARTVAKDPTSMAGVLAHLRGKETPMARLYEQMRLDGGTTGGMALSTRKQLEVSMAKIRKMHESSPRAAAQYLLEKVDAWNTLVEDSSRLSIYRTSLEKGMSRKQAAFLAKNSTINFNKKGTVGPIINAFYMFSNASIQGSAKMLRAMRNPKVAAAVAASVLGSVAVANHHNDAIDPDWRDKVTPWDRNSNLVVLLPTDDGVKYVTVPVSWGLKPFKVMSDYVLDAASGKSRGGVADAASGVVAAFMESYNPVGGNDIASTLSPTILDLPLEIRSNMAWHGGKIRPDWERDLPKSWAYFDSTRDSAIGQAAISGAQGIANASNQRIQISPEDVLYVEESLVGGAGRFLSRLTDTVAGIAKGKAPPPERIPVINRFFKKKQEDEIRANSREIDLTSYLGEQAIDRKKLSERSEDIYEELKRMAPDEANARAQQIYQEDPDVYARIEALRAEDVKGLTPQEKGFMRLGVENGYRARTIYDMLRKMAPDEANARLSDLYEKGVVTDEILSQLQEIRTADQTKNAP